MTVFADASAVVAMVASAIALDRDEVAQRFGIATVPIGDVDMELAAEALGRFGKGTGHPAQLNMGDCVACACAKANHAPLLYKGEDFLHTDLAS